MRLLDTVWSAPHSVIMRKRVVTAVGLLLCLSAGAQTPTPQQLGKALLTSSPDKYKTAPPIRQVRCQVLGDPTEFRCRYEQRRQTGRWQRYETFVAIDGDHWVIIDEPRPR
jgi:hypothetical protein